MQNLRRISYVLWAVSVVLLVVGGISRVTLAPVGGITARGFLGLAILLQLYTMSLLLLELVRHDRR